MALVPLARGGDGGGHDDMDARMKILEVQMREMRGDLKDLRSDLNGYFRLSAADLGELKGRVGQLPTITHLITTLMGLLVGAFAIIRYGIPH